MSNILIIKHGSLGDLIQANGAILDIKNSFKNSKVLLLTSNNFVDLMLKCPYIDGVITDKRFTRLIKWFNEIGMKVEKIDFSEISKLGGLFRCCTLPLRREKNKK